MTYSKPEVTVLGKAASIIESQTFPKDGSSTDSPSNNAHSSAYDLDE